jgi:HAE1 family hydrophobic/amphiphilic exporter-1
MGFLFNKLKAVKVCLFRMPVCSILLVSAASVSFGQETVPSPTPTPTPAVDRPEDVLTPPATLPGDPPPVAPNFASPLRPMPSTERVGVNNADQLSLTVEDAIRLALENNNDIDISRHDKQVEEFRLRGARGVYDPFVAAQG